MASAQAKTSPGADMAMTMSGCCSHMNMSSEASGPAKPMPCRPMSTACLMGCFGVVATIQIGAQLTDVPVAYSRVAYASFDSRGIGLKPTPEPLPPRSLVS
jgi:hypothetical protein